MWPLGEAWEISRMWGKYDNIPNSVSVRVWLCVCARVCVHVYMCLHVHSGEKARIESNDGVGEMGQIKEKVMKLSFACPYIDPSEVFDPPLA